VTKINIIPDKIPKQIWENKHISDAILYALGVYGSLKREEFINNREKGIIDRMDKNTFHKWAKRLKNRNYIHVSRINKKSLYTISNVGLNELLKRLTLYNLDLESIIDIEQKTILKNITQVTNFLALCGIQSPKILIEFLKFKKLILRNEFEFFTEDKLNNSILYFILNHLQFYNDYSNIYISVDNFIKNYSITNLTKQELKWFLHRVIGQKACGIMFYELKLESTDVKLYFRSNDEYGMRI
jgi:hypothetical protein